MTKCTIRDTGMTVGELRDWAGLPGSVVALSHENYVSIIDALEAALAVMPNPLDEAKKTLQQHLDKSPYSSYGNGWNDALERAINILQSLGAKTEDGK